VACQVEGEALRWALIVAQSMAIHITPLLITCTYTYKTLVMKMNKERKRKEGIPRTP
jgi:hypothetical protein